MALPLFATSVAAGAESYGELGHFGSAGIGHGQFKLPRETHAYAFGVDPTDNTVYVGDEPTAGEYRIQKLSATGQFVASVLFKPSNPASIEGIAVDPEKERVYVLAVAYRGSLASVDPEKRAAGTLYAFKTKASGEALESAVNGVSNEAKEGVLANPTTLETESEAQGHALLEPSGIAVDPTTHDVIVMGQEDQGEKGGVPQLRVALERVAENGTLGHRYVDTTDCFGGQGSAECEEGGTNNKEPSSPAVSQAGRVYVETFDEIWEIPPDFTSAQSPKVFVQFNPLMEELVEFPGSPPAAAGGGLSLAPEGASGGTIYTYAHITQEKEGKLLSKYPGALAIKYTENAGVSAGTELGWTGGQSVATGGGKCTIDFHESPSLAAGKEHDLFVFDPGPATAKHGAAPHVIEFGPGGTGCPTASASVPSASVQGQDVTEVPAGTKVTFSSTLEQANALSVEWNFGDGEAETVSTDEFQTTKVAHKYTLGGEHTITETIHTDDLQTPEIVVEGKLKVTGGSSGSGPILKTNPSNDKVVEGESA
ncbi:MAG TPA: PKD domain-containing protein, partial [Solirubrobacteraceae bacterium]